MVLDSDSRMAGTRKQGSKVTNPAGKIGQPVSLYPLSFEEAVSGLAQVKMPERDKAKPEAKPKKKGE
jgi:hypothetical protein